MTFDQFNLTEDLLAGIDAMNYQQATPVQELAIPKILAGIDLIASAQTGTGKTAAYLIPVLNRISQNDHDHTSVLVLVPTRELAKQIDEQVEGFGYFVQANSIAVYGGGKGDDWDKQRKALETGADIIVATPGRLIALMQLGKIDFSKLEVLILDEADKMLDMGFSDDIMLIVKDLPTDRQTLMFSATMPNKIRELAKKLLRDPEEIRLAVSKPAEKIDQQFYLAFDHQKLPVLAHLIQQQDVQSMVLFTSRKSSVNTIVKELKKIGLEARGVSSDIEQDEREAVLRGFKNKQFPILVATDVLSRGIDIDSLSHVVNFDSPRDAEDYVHRIGRTARADTTGTAITFVSDEDQDRIIKIEKLLEREFDKKAITEELGLGAAPEFDPRRFSGLRHKRGGAGAAGGRPAAGGRGNNDRNRYATPDASRPPRAPRPDRPDRPARPERPAPPVIEPVDSELITDEKALLNGEATVEQAPPRLLPDGTVAPKRKKRNKKRKPRPAGDTTTDETETPTDKTGEGDDADDRDDQTPSETDSEPTIESAAALPTRRAVSQPDKTVSQPDATNSQPDAMATQPDATAPPKRKKRNKKRKPRPAGDAATDETEASGGSTDSEPDETDDMGPVGSLNQRFLEGE